MYPLVPGGASDARLTGGGGGAVVAAGFPRSGTLDLLQSRHTGFCDLFSPEYVWYGN